jgi:beta-phosphoglucomutase-like phosphatase (HAD superfamily)
MVTIDVERFEAFIFDLDGVITQTASLNARAWKTLQA